MFNTFRLADFNFDRKRDLLGSGKHGYVYKVEYIKDHKIYALKMIKINQDDSEQMKNIFREYNIMLSVNHPYIEKCYGCFQEFDPLEKQEFFCFILEFIKGENLTKFLDRYKSMKQYIDQKLIIIILKEILNGLNYLHNQNILHRDITTDNIMIESDSNNIKITDFGISALYKQYNFNFQQNNMYSKQSVVGRSDFVSPEIYNAHKKGIKPVYDFKTDIYSLGITMFRLMTFCYPSCLKYRGFNFNYLDKIDPKKYDQNLIDIIMNMLQDDPIRRPSCEEIIKNFEIVEININKKEQNKSCFTSIMKCLANINQIYNYLVLNKRNRTNKRLNEDNFIVIKSFIEVLEKIKGINTLNNDFINKFIDDVSKKIIIFKEDLNLKSKTILQAFFNYFLMNLPKIYVYNNSKGYELYEKRNQNSQFFYINQKIEEYKEQYKNIFVNTFYFLVLKTYRCPECFSIIKQDIDIKFDIEFSNKGNINELLKDYFEKKEISNLSNLVCNKCDIMPTKIFELKNIYSAPEIFIFHFDYFVNLSELLEIKEKNENEIEKLYALKAIIFNNHQINNNNLINEIALKENEKWIYYSNNGKRVISFNEIINNGDICTVFYELSTNEFSVFS